MFLVEAESEEAALHQLQAELVAGGTPAEGRFVGGVSGHTIEGYGVIRVDDGADVVSWDQRNGAVVTAHGISSNFRNSHITELGRRGVIFLCDQCSRGSNRVYHPVNGQAKLEDVRNAI